jgi:hypothetical protein
VGVLVAALGVTGVWIWLRKRNERRVPRIESSVPSRATRGTQMI